MKCKLCNGTVYLISTFAGDKGCHVECSSCHAITDTYINPVNALWAWSTGNVKKQQLLKAD